MNKAERAKKLEQAELEQAKFEEVMRSVTCKIKPAPEDTMAFNQQIAEETLPSWHKSHFSLPALMHVIPLFRVARGLSDSVEVTYKSPHFGGIHYSGPALTQAHKRVFAELVSLRNGKWAGQLIVVRPYAMLAGLGWGDNSRNKETLHKILNELMAPKLTMWKHGGAKERGLYFRLVAEFDARDEDWEIRLSCTVVSMLKDFDVSWLSRKERKPLKDGLQTFLYDYWRAHPIGHQASYRELHAASGSRSTDIKEFGKQVRIAAKVIRVKCKWGLGEEERGHLKMFKTEWSKPSVH